MEVNLFDPKKASTIYTITFAIKPGFGPGDYENALVYLKGESSIEEDEFLKYAVEEGDILYALYEGLGNVLNLKPGVYKGKFQHVTMRDFENVDVYLMEVGEPELLIAL